MSTMDILSDYSLSKYNSFGIDVSAKNFTQITSVDELRGLLDDQKFRTEEKFILGGGSNILFTGDIDALVIHNKITGISVEGESHDDVLVRIGAGEVWHDVVLWAVNLGYAGIENLSLIPGYCGAAPIQNIGAYGVELKDVFERVEGINIQSGEHQSFDLNECEFGYRDSVFKRQHKGKFLLTHLYLRLLKSPRINTSYGAIEKELENMGVTSPGIKDVSDAVISIRQSKLPDPSVIGNAGSFFKNPIVTADSFASLKVQHAEIVSYPLGDDHVKLAAGWLIEACGWKGKRVGNTGTHVNQALVLVNYGDASGSEIYDLSQEIVDSVEERFGVVLEREVNVY